MSLRTETDVLEFIKLRQSFEIDDNGNVKTYDPDAEFVDYQVTVDEFAAALYAHPGAKCPSRGMIQPCVFCRDYFGDEVYTAKLQAKINQLNHAQGRP